MIINALNSGASVFMADFEDANTPKWDNNIQGHLNLRDAIRRQIDYVSPEGKAYKLGEKTATLFVRPRGWHLPEKHVLVDGKPISGGIFDFALYFFHNAKALIARGSGPYFYLPKLESHLEARLWNDIFVDGPGSAAASRAARSRPPYSSKPSSRAFEMDEILYELREHSAGLNAGRWDYIFSCIKKFRSNRDFCLADRALVTMTTHFHEELRRAADQDLPSAQHPRDGRHGGADPGQERREGQRRGVRQGQGRQGARGDVRPRRHVGCASRAWCRWPRRRSIA